VIKWAENPQKDTPPVFWLHGMAGEGKTSIAKTVSQRLKSRKRLGASFFFSRDIYERSQPNKVFGTIAFHLSLFDTAIGKEVSDVLETTPAPGDLTASEQFEKFILEPILAIKENFNPARPILIVVDALDECGTEEDRRKLLECLTKLPLSFRLFLSSRPLKDIQGVLGGMGPVVQHCDLGRFAVHTDISAFIKRRTQQIKLSWSSLQDKSDWPGVENHERLVKGASRLFIWAVTAMEFVDEEDPHGRLQLLLNAPASPLTALDSLFAIVLNQAYSSKPTTHQLGLFQKVIGSILVIADPLPISILGGLIDVPCKPCHAAGVVRDVFSRLRSVISMSGHENDPIRLIHPSFGDFLVDKTKSGRFFVDLGGCRTHFAIHLLDLIEAHGLRVLEPEIISYIMVYLPHHLLHAFEVSPDPLKRRLNKLHNRLQQLHVDQAEWHFHPDRSRVLWEQIISGLQVSRILYFRFWWNNHCI
jgi:hypothetical protein